MRTRLALTAIAFSFLCLVCWEPAWAELCEKCRDKAFTTDTKPCPGCDEYMSSGTWALCSKCAAEKQVCPACGMALPQKPDAPPEKKPLEIEWLESYDDAIKQAKEKQRPIFLIAAENMPLQEVVAQLRMQDVPVYFADDFPADKLAQPVTISMSSVPVKEAVSMLCEIARLSYEITADQIILRVK